MLNRLLPLFIIITLLSACKKDLPVNDERENKTTAVAAYPAAGVAKLLEILKKYEEPSQIITVTSAKPSKAIGKAGTIIAVNPQDFIAEDGKPLGTTVVVELKELTNQKQLLNSRAQTASNGKLLVSGGAYYINMTSDNRQLKLKEGKTLSVEFAKVSNNNMELFYGSFDSVGRMNWVEADQQFENYSTPKNIKRKNENTPTDTLPGEAADIDDIMAYTSSDAGKSKPTGKEARKFKNQGKNLAKLYKAIEVTQLGWINCDHFIEIANPTNVSLDLEEKEKYNVVLVYLVFRDINSLLCTDYYSGNDHPQFENIPVGSNVQLIVLSPKDDKIYSFTKNLTIQQGMTIPIDLKETPETEIAKLFSSK